MTVKNLLKKNKKDKDCNYAIIELLKQLSAVQRYIDNNPKASLILQQECTDYRRALAILCSLKGCTQKQALWIIKEGKINAKLSIDVTE